jgi:hypothetical protein
VTLSSFTVDCGWPKITRADAIQIASSKNIRVTGVNVRNVAADGIAISDGDHVRVDHCKIANVHLCGIRANPAGQGLGKGKTYKNRYIVVDSNTLDRTPLEPHEGLGAIFLGEEYCTISDNTITNPKSVGIGFAGHHSEISGNTIVGNYEGPGTGFGEAVAVSGSDNKILNNRISRSAASGILIFATKPFPSSNNVIENNVITGSGAQGIALVWGQNDAEMDNIIVRRNRVSDTNSFAIQSYAGTDPDSHRTVARGTWKNVRVEDNDLTGMRPGKRVWNFGVPEGVAFRSNRLPNGQVK